MIGLPKDNTLEDFKHDLDSMIESVKLLQKQQSDFAVVTSSVYESSRDYISSVQPAGAKGPFAVDPHEFMQSAFTMIGIYYFLVLELENQRQQEEG